MFQFNLKKHKYISRKKVIILFLHTNSSGILQMLHCKFNFPTYCPNHEERRPNFTPAYAIVLPDIVQNDTKIVGYDVAGDNKVRISCEDSCCPIYQNVPFPRDGDQLPSGENRVPQIMK